MTLRLLQRGRNKLQAVFGSSCDQTSEQGFGERRRPCRMIRSGIEGLKKEFLKALRRKQDQGLCVHVAAVREAVFNAAWEVNEVATRRDDRFPAHPNGQCPLHYLERLVLAMVNVRSRSTARRNGHLCHGESAIGVFT